MVPVAAIDCPIRDICADSQTLTADRVPARRVRLGAARRSENRRRWRERRWRGCRQWRMHAEAPVQLRAASAARLPGAIRGVVEENLVDVSGHHENAVWWSICQNMLRSVSAGVAQPESDSGALALSVGRDPVLAFARGDNRILRDRGAKREGHKCACSSPHFCATPRRESEHARGMRVGHHVPYVTSVRLSNSHRNEFLTLLDPREQ